jgi:hypothetical protein
MTEHRAIAERVSAGDARGAREAMRVHLASIFEAIDSIADAHAHFFVDSDPGAAPPAARRGRAASDAATDAAAR